MAEVRRAVVGATPPGQRRWAEYVAVTAGISSRYCSVRRIGGSTLRPVAMARVERRSDLADGVVQLDQTVRDAIGASVGSQVEVRELDADRRPLRSTITHVAGDLVAWLLPVRAAMLRSQPADLVGVEKRALLCGPGVLALLGIDEGDEVVVRGVDASSKVRRVRLRAYTVPGAILEDRSDVQRAEPHRFPDAAAQLGLSVDLPVGFIDGDARGALGIGGCWPILVRPKRSGQVAKEVREVMLVLAFTAVSFLTGDDRSVAQRAVLAAVVLLAGFVLIAWRLRSRLKP